MRRHSTAPGSNTCDILYQTSRSTLEVIGPFLKVFTKAYDESCFVTIRKAGVLANTFVLKWARVSDGDYLDCLDRATQAVLQNISLNQVAATYCHLLTEFSWSIYPFHNGASYIVTGLSLWTRSELGHSQSTKIFRKYFSTINSLSYGIPYQWQDAVCHLS